MTDAAVGDRTLTRLGEQVGVLAHTALAAMERHEWYRELAAEHRASVALVAEAGIRGFRDWLADERESDRATTVFADAPPELTRALSLEQTIELVRVTVRAVEDAVPQLADEERERDRLLVATLRFSRDTAFAAAHVYARAAEARGSWDARLESLVVDAVLRGEATEDVHSRAAALGWGDAEQVAVAVGAPRDGLTEPEVVRAVRSACQKARLEALVTLNSGRYVVVLAEVEDPRAAGEVLATVLDAGPVVVGPVVPHLFAGGRSARAALSGWAASRAWPGAPTVLLASELLPERVLAGDEAARRELVRLVVRPLQEAGRDLLATAETVLAHGGALEASARELFVHVNTVRYRLGRIEELVALRLADSRDRWVLRTALAVHRIDTPRDSGWRSAVHGAH
ncbi:PucR C-terminal helix-turn-helix domain-containing protein [Kytococcus aerolatus]|uniref:PucR C-terminal helix-turn-helix domain-containing protein n=1 Tax=Kytococcus aerolatus TaxID=592308 RepID=A0A212U2J4_9MICO|nr:helix-turn-helix domain-containing protein [Kytococcus aerolatus]SNC72472.1 PucR C-terminal helix-turn-helix domain-containing protein [Kytococcus aerolatus]